MCGLKTCLTPQVCVFVPRTAEPGDGAGVVAGSDGEFVLAVQDAGAGVFDDDGDELAGVAGAGLHALLVDDDLSVGVDPAAGGDRPAGSGAGGSGVLEEVKAW